MAGAFDEVLANSLIDQIPDAIDLRQLNAGLAVLTRDMFFYLKEHPRDDSGWLDDVVDQLEAEEIGSFGDSAFPYYTAQDTDHLPTGLAAAAAAGEFSFAPLLDRAIDHGWTAHPGDMLQRRYLARLGTRMGAEICGAGGLFEAWQKGRSDAKALPRQLTASVLKHAGLEAEAFWYPLSVCVGVTLAHSGLEAYCKKERTSGAT